ncbi:MAG: hypothetical protein CME70_24195 [Halobacteriovorax sp.]|nr:hypothetical protein [Halobacteriovorax sp.]|tara:strand:+ start:19653 stop:21248 length:1596 start_codon:yes stop_codon:yes gene_type:complete
MKTFYLKLLKAIVLLGLILNSAMASTDPQWMVKITSQVSEKESVTGTGYLVQVGNQIYVRTAAHVTLGLENVSLSTGDGQELTINKGQGLTNNSNDDQFISITQKDLKVLGVYKENRGAFIVNRETLKEAKESNKKKMVESGDDSAFYLVPSWTRGKPREFKSKGKSLLSSDLKGSAHAQELRSSLTGNVAIADMQIVPGESGSALIKENIIYGHAQSFQRSFEHSSFSTPKVEEKTVQALVKGKKGSLDNTIWKRQNGVFFRERQTKSGLVREANFITTKAGDGIIAGGGDGIIAGGGDGIIAGGGDGIIAGGGDGIIAGGNSSEEKVLPGMGMIYNDEPTYAFKVTRFLENGNLEKEVYYANWENYLYIDELMKNKKSTLIVKPITSVDELAKIIEKKSMNSPSAKRCSISQAELNNGFITISLPGFKSLRVSLESITPIHKIVRSSKDSSDWTVDLRGLFSVDPSELDKETKGSFITLRHPSFSHVRLACKLEMEEIQTKAISQTSRNTIKTKTFPTEESNSQTYFRK